jgi:hypothetical protein
MSNVIFVSRLRKHVGCKVAVTALGPAERDGDVEAERHTFLFYGTVQVYTRAQVGLWIEIARKVATWPHTVGLIATLTDTLQTCGRGAML